MKVEWKYSEHKKYSSNQCLQRFTDCIFIMQVSWMREGGFRWCSSCSPIGVQSVYGNPIISKCKHFHLLQVLHRSNIGPLIQALGLNAFPIPIIYPLLCWLFPVEWATTILFGIDFGRYKVHLFATNNMLQYSQKKPHLNIKAGIGFIHF